MNSRIEVCRNCKVQCTLQDQSEIFVERALKEGLKGLEVKEKVSLISQKASAIGCPSSEISYYRDETIKAIDPAAARRFKRTQFVIYPSTPSEFRFPDTTRPSKGSYVRGVSKKF